MAVPRFFSSQPLPRSSPAGAPFELPEEIARHLHVLRMLPADTIVLFDGCGGEWLARIVEMGKRAAAAQLLEFNAIERESPLHITLVQSLATSDKMDFIVQKAVELGVAAIQPVASERATMKLAGDRVQKRVAHWQAVAQAACEQCGRNRIPVVSELLSLDQWLSTPAEGPRLILHPVAARPLVEVTRGMTALALLIGPEGGFSDREVMAANRENVQAVTLGPRVLRTETAGQAALAALNAVSGDFR